MAPAHPNLISLRHIMQKHLSIATRGSALALWQANHVKQLIEQIVPDTSVSLNIIKTQGDLNLEQPLAQIGGKGLFVKEIEEALLQQRADLAVHSVKDIPSQIPDGLIIGCIPERADSRDCYISYKYPKLETLPQHAKVGTTSLRRQAQLRALRPDLEILPLRGNIDTRLKKLQTGIYDAIILAYAGISRLELEANHVVPIDAEVMLPAVGQGALGIECHEDNYDLLVIFSQLEDRNARICVEAERSFLKRLDGGCQVPIAAHAQMTGENSVSLTGLIASTEGCPIFRETREGASDDVEKLGISLADSLLAKGGKNILAKYQH